MTKGEKSLGSGDASIVRVVVPECEAMARGVVEAIPRGDDVEVRLEEPLLPLQDSWYCSHSLFPAVGTPKVSPPRMPKKWILKGEAPSLKAVWVPAASRILDLQFQRKELLPAPIQFLNPYSKIVGWSNWVEQEVANEGFCQILKDAKIFKALFLSRGWNMYRDGETMVTLKDVERICLLPSMGDINLLELELSDEEFVIAGKLLETFRDTSAP
nr:hypothetical protein CFP56_71785 [Quercus suber]